MKWSLFPAASEQINEYVSGPFVQFFVKTVGHYASYIKREANGQGRFQERSFYKALHHKPIRRFVKKFVKTQLFSLFIQEAEKSKNPPAGNWQPPSDGVGAVRARKAFQKGTTDNRAVILSVQLERNNLRLKPLSPGLILYRICSIHWRSLESCLSMFWSRAN